jgi:ribosomal protein S18 acetylase RimI-like enzyme
MQIRPYQSSDEESVIELWKQCNLTRPWNDPRKDIRRKLAVNPEWFLIAQINGAVVGTLMAGYEGHRGWINYLAVSPDRRREGIGRELMLRAEKILAEVNCPKINLQVRTTNAEAIEFYRAIGYAVDDVISMGKRLQKDS